MCKILILWSEISPARWLLYGEIIAGAVAGVGIIWETMKGGEAFERVAQRCVIWGGVAETLFSIGLFIVEDAAATDANNKAATAIERAANLEKEAADERQRTAEIEAVAAWRHLTDEQVKGLTDAFSKRPDISVLVMYVFGDPESELLAGQITNVLPRQSIIAVEFEYFMPFGIYIPDVRSTHDDVKFIASIPLTKA